MTADEDQALTAGAFDRRQVKHVAKQVGQAFQTESLSIDSEGATIIAEKILQTNDWSWLDVVKDRLDLEALDSNVVTVEEVYQAFKAHAGDEGDEGDESSKDLIFVISAFECPKIVCDPIRRTFFLAKEPPKAIPDASARVGLMRERLALLHQRLLRNKIFTRPALDIGRPDHVPFCDLCAVQALLGSTGHPRVVLGVLSQLEEGRYYLEDATGSVALDLSEAEWSPGFFTEACVAVVEGVLQHDNTFKATALGFPPVEDPVASKAAAHGLNFFGAPVLTDRQWERMRARAASRPDERIVFVADVWLDRPDVVANLERMLTVFQSLVRVPALVVLMGNFLSHASTSRSHPSAGQYREAFASLSRLLSRFTRMTEESRFVIVPGPGDLGLGNVLPRAPFPKDLVWDLVESGIEVMSDPCRIRYASQEIVVFRDNLQRRMRKLCILTPKGDPTKVNEEDNEMFHGLVSTQLQQSHLCPIPIRHQPVMWDMDHALRLYPAPNVLVMADETDAAHTMYDDLTTCMNPGSFGASRTFVCYLPNKRSVEMSQVPEQDGP